MLLRKIMNLGLVLLKEIGKPTSDARQLLLEKYQILDAARQAETTGNNRWTEESRSSREPLKSLGVEYIGGLSVPMSVMIDSNTNSMGDKKLDEILARRQSLERSVAANPPL
jgi:hypothetical protein